MPLRRFLSDEHDDELRQHLTRLTFARFLTGTAYRFIGPFAGVIATGLGVSLSTVGVAIGAGDLTGLAGPLAGAQIDRRGPRAGLVVGASVLVGGAVIAAVTRSLMPFAVALILMSIGKVTFDNAMTSWVSSRTPYETRGRVIGLIELSWAVSTIVGLPLMGVITGFSSFRVAYGVIAVGIALVTVHLARRLPRDRPAVGSERGRVAWNGQTVAAIVAFAFMAAAIVSMFVTFGAWLQDEFGLSSKAIGGAAFLIGFAELAGSSATATFADRIGKRRTVLAGAALFAPATLLIGLAEPSLPMAIALLGLCFGGFELAIVSFIPIIPSLQPQAPGAAFGFAGGVSTVLRAMSAVLATRAYEHWGIVGPTVLSATCMAVTASLVFLVVREPER